MESGSAKVFVGNLADEGLVLFIMQPGDFVGDIALLDESFRSASLVVLEASTALCFSKGDFHRLLDYSPGMVRSIILSLTRRLRKDSKRIRSLVLDLVYRRLREKFYEPAVLVENSELLILLRRFSHRELGTMIGAFRQMVSKVLSDSIFGGYVELRDGVLVIVRMLP